MASLQNDTKFDVNMDFSKIDLSKISSDPDFITVHNKRGREFGSQLVFNIGHAWLGGYFLGGLWGVFDGYRNAVSPTFKVRLNSVLNGHGVKGSKFANILGSVGKMKF